MSPLCMAVPRTRTHLSIPSKHAELSPILGLRLSPVLPAGLRILHCLMLWAALNLAAAHGEDLPERVDHTGSPYFPPIVHQTHESCALDTGISTMMTYEWNRLRGTSAALPENRLAGHFLWNFLNRGENRGAELVEGWQLAQAMGAPTAAAYEAQTITETPLGTWPHGYAFYHEAMRHRVRHVHFAPLTTVNDLMRAKRWLHRRDGKSPPGGLFAVEGRLRGFHQVKIPDDQFESGKTLVLRWGRQGAGHVMAYAGYDDRVGFDLNGDQEITNDVDLNGDGKITLADWERGAFIAVNSYGRDWGDDGKTYVLYRESAVTPFRRGRWAAALDVLPDYRPRFTLRLTLQTTCQAAVRLRLHSANEETSFTPLLFDSGEPAKVQERTILEQYSRFITGERRLTLGPARQDAEGRTLPVELGIDLTGQLPMNAPDYTMEFHLDPEIDPACNGIVWEAHLRQYRSDGTLLRETAFDGLPQRMQSEKRSVHARPPGRE